MVFKKNIKDLMTVGTSNFFASIINSLFWLYLASILLKTEYGELGFIMSIATVGAAASLLGMRTTVVVYESKNENILPSSFIVILISSSISAFIFSLFTNNLFIGILIIGMTVFELVLGGLSAKQRFRDFSISRLLRSVITIVLALILYHQIGIDGILIGYFFGTLIILKDVKSLLKNKKISFSILKQKIRFILEAYTSRLSYVFFLWGDKMIIGLVFGFTILANYHFAMQFLFLLDTIPRTFATYFTPKEAAGEKNKKIKVFSILIAILITIISFIAVPYGVMEFLPNYEESIVPMQILSLALVPLSISGIQQAEFFGQEKSRPVLLGGIMEASLYIISLVVLGQLYGLIGMAISFLIAVWIRVSFNFFFSKKFAYN